MPILVDYLFYRLIVNQVRYIEIHLLSSIHCRKKYRDGKTISSRKLFLISKASALFECEVANVFLSKLQYSYNESMYICILLSFNIN